MAEIGVEIATAAVVRNREPRPARKEHLIRGTVRWEDSGHPVQDAAVIIRALDEGEPIGKGRTDEAGRFEISIAGCVEHSSLELYAIVQDVCGTVLSSTQECPVRVAGRDIQWDLTADPALNPVRAVQRPAILLGGIAMDALAVSQAKPEIAVEIVRALLDKETRPDARKRIEALSPLLLLGRRAPTTLCGTSILLALEALIKHKEWPEETRYSIYDMLGGVGAGFTELIYDSANFSIHYYLDGPSAVAADTSSQDVIDPGTATVLATLPAGDPPTYIKRVAFWLERALNRYVTAPFNLRNPAGAGRIPVYINTAPFGSADASAFYLNNALSNDMIAAVTVHELFHMVQFQYPGDWSSSTDWAYSLREGGAVWAENSNTQLLNRYLDEAGTNFNGIGVQAQPQQSLLSSGYKCSLFWTYLSEQQSGIPPAAGLLPEPLNEVGADVYKPIVEACSAGTFATSDLKNAIRNLPWYQDFYEFGYLDPAQLDRTSSETVYGNYLLACRLEALGGAGDRRFNFLEDRETIFIDNALAAMGVTDPPQPGDKLAPVTLAGTGTLGAAGSVLFSNSLVAFGSRFYEVQIDPAVTSVRVQYSASGLVNGLFQIALIDEDSNLRNVYRSDRASYGKQFANLLGGKRLSKVVLIASGTDTGGSFMLGVTAETAASNVMVTKWNSIVRNEYELDSRNWAWTWVSPDVWVDNDGDGMADGEVFFNYDNQLFIRLHNEGNADAAGINVAFYYQDGSGGLSPGAWLPVQDMGGVTQALSGLSLAAGTSNQWSVNWSPNPSGSSHHFCIRAVVTVPGDPNTDNKRVLSNFGNVDVRFGGFGKLTLVRRNLAAIAQKVRLTIVPHLPPGLVVSTPDLRAKAIVHLEPGAAVYDSIRVQHTPAARKPIAEVKPIVKQHACGFVNVQTAPDPRGDYPIDPRALPPGLAGKPMITLVHSVDGHPQGGMTFMITVDGQGD
jgi:hypothetical protein